MTRHLNKVPFLFRIFSLVFFYFEHFVCHKCTITEQMQVNREPIVLYITSIIVIILSSLSFSKPIERFQTCISMASLCHQCASIRLWSTLMRLGNCSAKVAWLCWLRYKNYCLSIFICTARSQYQELHVEWSVLFRNHTLNERVDSYP